MNHTTTSHTTRTEAADDLRASDRRRAKAPLAYRPGYGLSLWIGLSVVDGAITFAAHWPVAGALSLAGFLLAYLWAAPARRQP